MLKEATIKKMASLLKIKPEDLTAAITAQEETDIEIDDTLTLFDESEVALLKKNNYEEGKKAGAAGTYDEHHWKHQGAKTALG
mgnify:CR=1 FL=1